MKDTLADKDKEPRDGFLDGVYQEARKGDLERMIEEQSCTRTGVSAVFDRIRKQSGPSLKGFDLDLIGRKLEAYAEEAEEADMKDAHTAAKAIRMILSILSYPAETRRTSLAEVRKGLDATHVGMNALKETVLDQLAVDGADTAMGHRPILLYGPAGTGKTSFAVSLADALGLKSHVIPLGGADDSSGLTGYNFSYKSAHPGLVVDALLATRSRNPVIILDEVDKVSSCGGGERSDVTAALLSILDPRQMRRFTDSFLGVPIDLSGVRFILCANDILSVPEPLRDRCLCIPVSGYGLDDKMTVASFLAEKKTAMLSKADPSFSLDWPEPAVRALVCDYAPETGVRHLEKLIETVNAYCFRKHLEDPSAPRKVTSLLLGKVLGRTIPLHTYTGGEPGKAPLLAVLSSGSGMVMEVQAVASTSSGSTDSVTGLVGQLMAESASVVVEMLRHDKALSRLVPGIASLSAFVHYPLGVAKDGDSAGLATTCAIVSSLLGIPLEEGIAMTGAVDVLGHVLAVGGIEAKLLAARKAGFSEVLLPSENAAELKAVSRDATRGMRVTLVGSAGEALARGFPTLSLQAAPSPGKTAGGKSSRTA